MSMGVEKTGQLALCLQPPAKILGCSSLLKVMLGRKQCLEEKNTVGCETNDTSVGVLGVSNAFCDITKGPFTKLSH